jgi:hypothetical protein
VSPPGGDQQKARRRKQAATAGGVGAVAIAAALSQMLAGEPVDCSAYAKCRRTVEAARAETLCEREHAGQPRKHLECVADITDGWQDTVKQCPPLDFKRECAPFVAQLPIDPNVPLPAPPAETARKP